MKYIKQYEEFNWFGLRKNRDPQEEYRRQARQAEKERQKMLREHPPLNINKEYPTIDFTKNQDPYNEEDWESGGTKLSGHDIRINAARQQYGGYLEGTPFEIIYVWESKHGKVYEIKQQGGDISFEIRQGKNYSILNIIKTEGDEDEKQYFKVLHKIKIPNVDKGMEYIAQFGQDDAVRDFTTKRRREYDEEYGFEHQEINNDREDQILMILLPVL